MYPWLATVSPPGLASYRRLPYMLGSHLILLASVGTAVLASSSLAARQDNTNSTCLVYGIDFVEGGSYFVNSNSKVDFTTVQQFSGCNDDSASILLVQQSTEDEYECTSVPTGQNSHSPCHKGCGADLLCSTDQYLTALDMSYRERSDEFWSMDNTSDRQQR
jgi:hypothetical protein